MGKRSRQPMHSRSDIPLLALLLIVAFFLELQNPRVYPIPLANSSLQNSHLPDIVPTLHLLVFGILLPPLIAFLVSLPPNRQHLFFLLGVFEALIVTVILTNTLKLIIGRPRPYFSTVCDSYVSNSSTECTGDAHAVSDARKSFPSGHSSFSFAAATYLSLFLSHRFPHIATWRLLVVLAPYVVAGLVAASRVIDYHHHYADIVAGSVLGTAVAAVAFEGRKETFLPNADYEVLPVDAV